MPLNNTKSFLEILRQMKQLLYPKGTTTIPFLRVKSASLITELNSEHSKTNTSLEGAGSVPFRIMIIE